ncbi:F-box only protein 15 [Lepisosteus oculatus]|uniref:F-box only protein 15 n=1 Tax=Lepisosteus oculatus TaxID=7918 RepID=UPI0037225C00
MGDFACRRASGVRECVAMATGRGRVFRNYRLGLERLRSSGGAPRAGPHERPQAPPRSPHNSSQVTPKVLPSKPKACGRSKICKTPAATSQVHIESLPSEMLLKILAYVDAASLLCMGSLNKRFHTLVNDNSLWYRLYSREWGAQKWRPSDEVAEALGAASVSERPDGYWKRLYLRKVAVRSENRWRSQLKAVSPYTGLPSHTEQVLRSLHVTWEISILDKRGRETTFEQSYACFFESSVAVCWRSTCWPFLKNVSTLQLHGVARDGPVSRRSLVAKYDLDGVRGKFIGSDKLVNMLHIPPGLIVGVWRGQMSIAFFMVTLHFHKLVERSILGTSVCPYTAPVERCPFDDVDPNYGLHGYTLHISLHSSVKQMMSGHFTHLFCRKDQIRNGFIPLRVIRRNDMSQHTSISGKINTPWKTEVLEGIIQNCCMVSLTLLDEAQNPFWCVSTPVSLQLSSQESVSYDYMGENYVVSHGDADGRVLMELVWLEEQGQFFLVHLVVSMATEKVNKHFGREY